MARIPSVRPARWRFPTALIAASLLTLSSALAAPPPRQSGSASKAKAKAPAGPAQAAAPAAATTSKATIETVSAIPAAPPPAEATAAASVAPAGESAPPEPPAEKPPIAERLQHPITVDFRDVSLQSALDFLAQSSDINIVPGPEVDIKETRVTMRFKELPMIRALKYLLQNQGLIYRIDPEAVVILAPGDEEKEPLETRLYPLRFGAGNFASFPSSSGLGSTKKEMQLGSSSGSVKFTTVKDSLDEIVPQVSGSALVLDTRSNTLIATNTPKNLRLIEQLLESLDRPTYQVLIEARLMEVSVNNLRELGITLGNASDITVKKQTGADGTQTPAALVSKSGGISFQNFSRSTEGFNVLLQGILTRPQYNATLHALAETGKAKTLSVPSVTAANRQNAVVKFADEFIYASRFEPTVQFGALGATDATFVLAPQDFVTRDIGIVLNVTPDVGSDGKTVTLSLAPEVSEAVANFFTFGGTASFPKFTTRTVNTEVVVRDGETVMLGGLIKETRVKTTTGVPFIRHIPLIGPLTDHKNESVSRSNLLIFVTVHVIAPDLSSPVAQSAAARP